MEEITEKIRPIAENYNIDKVYLFGSYARGEAVEESDIDLIVNAEKLRGLKFFGFYEDLKEAFQKNVDLITETQIETVVIHYIKDLLKNLKQTER